MEIIKTIKTERVILEIKKTSIIRCIMSGFKSKVVIIVRNDKNEEVDIEIEDWDTLDYLLEKIRREKCSWHTKKRYLNGKIKKGLHGHFKNIKDEEVKRE